MSKQHGPVMPNNKAKDFKGTIKRLLTYLSPFKVKLILVFVAAIASTVFSIVGPKIMGEATTKLFEGIALKAQGVPGAAVDFDFIGNIIILLIVLYIISAIFSYLQQYIMASVAQRTVYQIRKDVDEKLTKLPLKFYDARPHGDVLSRVVNDVDNIANTLQQSLMQLITSVITIIGVLVMMLSISPILTLIVILTLPLSAIVIKFIAGKSQGYFIGQQRSLGELSGHVEEMFTGHNVVKVFGQEKDSIEKFEEINDELYNSGWKAQFVSGIMMPMIQFIGNLGYVAVCIVGSIFVTNGRITIGDVQAFISYVRQFTSPIMQTANIANVIQSTVASAERVFELLDEDEEVLECNEPITLPTPKGSVQFEHVKFGYSEDAILMQDLTIDVRPGQTVAIVGPTGAGKTTMINLLMRFYELNGGRITIDGVDITDMKRVDLRSLFGMVLQDTWLFKGTIEENIAYSLEGATKEQVVKAAKAARADQFIRTLPEGYNTILNEDASNISQGQKQLLTIARAILADPSILILDEATSSIDTRTEILIQKAMDELMEGRTSFVIAHRLSTIKEADLILVMDKGTIIEQGSHLELLEQDGFYADLYYSQFTTNNVEAV